MKELVILDMDGVIIRGQSQQIFLGYLFRKRIVGLFFYLKIYFWFILYKLGLVENPKRIMAFAFSLLAGKGEEDIKRLVNDFFDNTLKKFIFSEMIGIIDEHKSKNRELIIISNAADFIVKKVAEFLDINNYIGTKLEVSNGKLTGKISGEIIYEKNKISFVKKFIENNNLDFKNSWIYSDHISDLGLLLLASNPYAVNPDNLLKREAEQRYWPILKLKK